MDQLGNQLNDYMGLINGLYDGSVNPYNGAILHDLTALGTIALVTLVGALLTGVAFGPIIAWAYYPKTRKVIRAQHRPPSATNALVVECTVILGMLQSMILSAFRLFQVQDIIVGLATVLAAILVLILWYPVLSIPWPDWFTIGLHFVSVTLTTFTLGFVAVFLLTWYVLPTRFIWNLTFVYVIVASVLGVLGLLVALLAVGGDLDPT
jgi:hypothetical protein